MPCRSIADRIDGAYARSIQDDYARLKSAEGTILHAETDFQDAHARFPRHNRHDTIFKYSNFIMRRIILYLLLAVSASVVDRS
jgi:hypothetical protein